VSSSSQSPKPLANVKLLVVDDAPDTLRVLTKILQKSGGNVTACSTVDKALECFTNREYDVIVSDIAMPEKDGYDFIKTVRKLEDGADHMTPAMAVTADDSSDTMQRVFSEGFQVYMPKPIDSTRLLHALQLLKDLNGMSVRNGVHWDA
jgi:CheY-like chemotaxis protein